MPEFIPGLQLSQAYYWEAIRPILDQHFPGLQHSAALIGYGSDVMGFDTPVSRDHMWGPRVVLFLPEPAFAETSAAVLELLRHQLPVRFRGYSTHFSKPDLQDGGTRGTADVEHGPVDPLIFFHTIAGFWKAELGADLDRTLTPADWLTFGEQRLLSLTAGQVFHDDLGLEAVRARFAYYPQDVWLYLLATQWSLLSQQEAFVGRTSSVGDELGSRLVTAHVVTYLMRLAFLMEKRYPPYAKWFSTGFKQLSCYPALGPLLEGALAAATYPEREACLAPAYSLLAQMHNALQLTPPLDPRTRTYSGWHLLRAGITQVALDDPRNTRPHQVIFGGRFADALTAAIQDPAVQALVPELGSVNQFLIESSAALQSNAFCRGLVDDLLADPE